MAAKTESHRLVELIDLKPGAVVAEIGSGDGEMTVDLARILGPRTRIYSTELKEELPALRQAVRDAKLNNVTVLEAGMHATNLPSGCCDAVFMRRVYHHFRQAERNNRSAFASLRPGGRMVIIDFQPKKHWKPPQGVNHRGGHGVSQKEMIREVERAGFKLERIDNDWPDDMYAVVFRRP